MEYNEAIDKMLAERGEDWLEKKMLCFLGRYFTGGLRGEVYFRNAAQCKNTRTFIHKRKL